MPASSPLRRALLLTILFGALVSVGLGSAVRVSVTQRTAALPSSMTTAEREAFAGAAAASAARVAMLAGIFATLSAAVVVTALTTRRVKLQEALAHRVGSLGRLTTAEGAWRGEKSAGVPTDRLIRRLTEIEAAVGRRVARLENERRRGFHVLDHMTDGVLAVDAERRVQLLNPAARRLLRLNRDALLGRRLAEVVRIPQIVTAVDGVLAGRSQGDTEVHFPSNPERFLKVQTIPLPVEGAPGVLITVRDESQMRQLERMRREFIANVSHELKTPLAAVKGYAETLQLGAKEDPETCTHFLQQIGLQAERLERLINDMLQLARAQAGTESLALTRVPLLPVLRESFATYEPLAQGRGLTLTFFPPPSDAAVVADREALLTITNNLVGNAVRYTPEGGHVELRCHTAEGYWSIEVADDGVGIPEQDQKRIFERFYRVEKARDASRGGTGLGLSIVKNLAQALGGEVHLQSRPGEGSSFEVRLPAAER